MPSRDEYRGCWNMPREPHPECITEQTTPATRQAWGARSPPFAFCGVGQPSRFFRIFRCSREAGHSGDHVAHTWLGRIFARWAP